MVDKQHLVCIAQHHRIHLRRVGILPFVAQSLASQGVASSPTSSIEVAFPGEAKVALVGESRTLFGRVSGMLPASVTLKLARKSIQDYSEQAGHDLSYRLEWES